MALSEEEGDAILKSGNQLQSGWVRIRSVDVGA